MLEVARSKSHHAEIIEADLTRADALGDRQFDLITAFRFFPNAQNSLRMEAMGVLVRHLAPSGFLVFNNHKNSGSSVRRLSRLLGRANPDEKVMAHQDVVELTNSVGLEISRVYHLGVFPATEKHTLLPEGILHPLEISLSWCGPLRCIARNLIYVCHHSGADG
jgi:predicted TPR repeat methyltransferase